MDTLYIPQIAKLPDRTAAIDLNEYLPELASLTPVQGQIQVIHQGNYLEVSAIAETIVTLTCDRCLQQYNHRLKLKTSEMIWLQEGGEDLDGYPVEREVTVDELVEILAADGYFDPTEWLYQQLCLGIPHRQLCDKTCEGIATGDELPAQTLHDRRWASLEALRNQMLN